MPTENNNDNVISNSTVYVTPEIIDDDSFVCARCQSVNHIDDHYVISDNNDDLFCFNCFRILNRENEENNNIDFRDYMSGKKLIRRGSKNLSTKILQSNRAFGIELECYGNRDGVVNVSKTIDKSIGISTDGSISSNGTNFEMQFPLVNGKIGEELVFNTCQTLIENDIRVNSTCGYHVHLESKKEERKYEYIKMLMLFSTIFENVIITLLPKSRVDNRFCQKISRYISISEIMNCQTKSDLDYLWYKTTRKRELRVRKHNKYDSSRYYGFNFHCVLGKNKHLEVRYHNGTINPYKILHWVNLHNTILDFVYSKYKEHGSAEKWNEVNRIIDSHDNYYGKLVSLPMLKYFMSLIGLSNKSQKYFISRYKKFVVNSSETEE